MSYKPLMLDGERLKEIRIKRGLTQDGLAAKAGISMSYISTFENKTRANYSIKIVNAIAEALEVDAIYLFKEEVLDPLPAMPEDVLNFILEGGNEDWIRFAAKLKGLGKDPREYLKALEYVSPEFQRNL